MSDTPIILMFLIGTSNIACIMVGIRWNEYNFIRKAIVIACIIAMAFVVYSLLTPHP
jgi:hypothetical protein